MKRIAEFLVELTILYVVVLISIVVIRALGMMLDNYLKIQRWDILWWVLIFAVIGYGLRHDKPLS